MYFKSDISNQSYFKGPILSAARGWGFFLFYGNHNTPAPQISSALPPHMKNTPSQAAGILQT
ncbi:hypothetical protein, partial [Enterocloster lavalensis]|uniref:hypothetical protein n=1 Tax=Enterocloster lavalensis TaxID=460384 RepID=UPI002FD9FF10